MFNFYHLDDVFCCDVMVEKGYLQSGSCSRTTLLLTIITNSILFHTYVIQSSA